MRCKSISKCYVTMGQLHLFIFIVMVLKVYVSCNIPENSTLELIMLLKIANTSCDEINWCLVSNKLENNSYSTEPSCCLPCSCDSSCYRSMNCCPDKKLTEIYQENNFTTVDDYVAFLTAKSKTVSIDVNWRHYTIQTSNVKDTGNIKCISSSTFGWTQYRAQANSYKMVTKCTDASTASPEVKEKCEHLHDNTPYALFKDIIPVQSRQSGTVYRNVHCLQCSYEAGTEFETWDMYYSCTNGVPSLINSHINSFEELLYHTFDNAQRQYYFPCNFDFKPRHHITNDTEICYPIDVDSCQHNTSDQTLTSTCMNYYNPISIYFENRVKSFNNLACLTCNGYGLSGEDMCGLERWLNLEFVGKIYMDTNKIGYFNGSTMNKEHSISNQFSMECQKGQLYDTLKKTCRTVLCPCGMIVINGKCQLLFSELLDQLYQVYISIEVSEVFSDKAQLIGFQNNVLTYFKTNFELFQFEIKKLQLYQSDEEIDLKADFLALIVFCGKESVVPLSGVMSMIYGFRGEKKFNVFGHSISLQLKIPGILDIQQDFIDDPLENKHYLPVHSDTVASIILSDRNIVKIGECSFCYRVEILPDDFTRVKRRSIQIKRNKKYAILSTESRMYLNSSRFVVCAELLFDDIIDKRIYTDPPNKVNDIIQNENSSTKDTHADEKGITTIIIVFVAIFVIVSSLTIRNRCKHVLARQSNLDT